MANIGFSELLVILMILALVFGASRLPDLGESLGKTVRNFKRGMNENPDIKVTPVDKQVATQSSARPADANANVSDAELVDEKKQS
ncbi:MAG TPA: twin-arginine translocase TatA/TatE family subunit [Polyangiales bacterium]|jgi:sec-independent protein translocase protein TatA|nr:twin-arginine translocase TatA/TatE family subunit [Polyangiales bacterium]